MILQEAGTLIIDETYTHVFSHYHGIYKCMSTRTWACQSSVHVHLTLFFSLERNNHDTRKKVWITIITQNMVQVSLYSKSGSHRGPTWEVLLL